MKSPGIEALTFLHSWCLAAALNAICSVSKLGRNFRLYGLVGGVLGWAESCPARAPVVRRCLATQRRLEQPGRPNETLCRLPVVFVRQRSDPSEFRSRVGWTRAVACSRYKICSLSLSFWTR